MITRPTVTINNHTSTTQSLNTRQKTGNLAYSVFDCALSQTKKIASNETFSVELVPSDGNLIFSERTRQLQETLLSFAMRIFETTRSHANYDHSINSVLVTTDTTTVPPTVSVRVTDAVNYYDIATNS